MTAPLEEFTPAQAEHLARIEAASPAPESWEARVETAAREHFGHAYVPPGAPIDAVTKFALASFRAGYVIAESAALASAAPETDGLRERVEALAGQWEREADALDVEAELLTAEGSPATGASLNTHADAHRSYATEIRAALASHTPGGEE